MIDGAMDGTFSEDDFEETELSKLEVKWKRFLTFAKLSNQKSRGRTGKNKGIGIGYFPSDKDPLSEYSIIFPIVGRTKLRRKQSEPCC